MLTPGDIAPFFNVRSSVNDDFHFDTVAGRCIVLSFFASSQVLFSRELLAEVSRRKERFDVKNAIFFGVSVDPEDRERLSQESNGIIYFWDFDMAVSRLYGVTNETAHCHVEVPKINDAVRFLG